MELVLWNLLNDLMMQNRRFTPLIPIRPEEFPSNLSTLQHPFKDLVKEL